MTAVLQESKWPIWGQSHYTHWPWLHHSQTVTLCSKAISFSPLGSNDVPSLPNWLAEGIMLLSCWGLIHAFTHAVSDVTGSGGLTLPSVHISLPHLRSCLGKVSSKALGWSQKECERSMNLLFLWCSLTCLLLFEFVNTLYRQSLRGISLHF